LPANLTGKLLPLAQIRLNFSLSLQIVANNGVNFSQGEAGILTHNFFRRSSFFEGRDDRVQGNAGRSHSNHAIRIRF
jgi:hypothetical protein